MPRISIIIPCYRIKESELRRCLNSVFKQPFEDYEIILINDGGDSLQTRIIEEYQEAYQSVKAIHFTKNCGVSYARNKGVEEAKGDYITFLDADDEMNECFLSDAFKIIDETNCRLLIGGLVFCETKPDHLERTIEYTKMPSKDFVKYSIFGKAVLRINDNSYIGRGPVARVIAADIAKSISFNPELSIGEDIVWNLQLLKKVPDILVCKSVWYIYYKNNSSATHVFNPSIINALEKELTFIKKEIDCSDKTQFNSYLLHIFEELNRIDKQFFSKDKSLSGKALHDITCRLYDSAPWTDIKKFDVKDSPNIKYKLQYYLYLNKMLFKMWYLKRKITGRH